MPASPPDTKRRAAPLAAADAEADAAADAEADTEAEADAAEADAEALEAEALADAELPPEELQPVSAAAIPAAAAAPMNPLLVMLLMFFPSLSFFNVPDIRQRVFARTRRGHAICMRFEYYIVCYIQLK